MRKVALKRFQLLSKCVDYKMATIYMESSNWDIEEAMRPKMKFVDLQAVAKYNDDLEWEKRNPKKERTQMRHIRRSNRY